MAIPGPLAVARRLSGALVGRPRAALRPYLHESYSEDPALFEEAMTIASGAGSFALLSLCAFVTLVVVACYALCYPVLVGFARLAGALRAGVGR
ncbi:hypothetical protein GCM10009037_00260 [Halarchaeum grantii]|uniref:Uncharacterized protein n=1 Tax=Halarchaeum grantii TaxID=1193105 RepID=A0A830EXX9_9EURY|nr:hypothetical protein [Halarchaeum grantii]GGL20929.1 hypothetical protein GCM10009037_00260 [Halarchaeum grantii]